MSEIDNVISKLMKKEHLKDIKAKRIKCRKCGYPVSDIAGVRVCKRCLASEID